MICTVVMAKLVVGAVIGGTIALVATPVALSDWVLKQQEWQLGPWRHL